MISSDSSYAATEAPPAPTLILPANEGAPPQAAPEEEYAGVVRPYVNDRLNGRIGMPLPRGRWRIRWQSELTTDLEPEFVLHAGGRTVVQGGDFWELFDREGKSITAQRRAASDLVLDPDNGLLYAAVPTGSLGAYNLRDGEQEFKLILLFGPEFRRVFFSRRGDRIVVASVEQPVDIHEPEPPEYSLVEVHDLGNPVRSDDLQIVTSAQKGPVLTRAANVLHAALDDERLVFTTPGRVEHSDLNLSVSADLQADFTPLSLSLDEAGRAYLVVLAESGAEESRPVLWVVTSRGEKVIDVAILASSSGGYSPPVVGYDHTVFVVAGDSIQAVGSGGEALWTQHAGGPVAGAVVLSDGQLLVASGGMLASYDRTGERAVLFFLDDERWATPPSLTPRGEILVATQQRLFCLGLER